MISFIESEVWWNQCISISDWFSTSWYVLLENTGLVKGSKPTHGNKSTRTLSKKTFAEQRLSKSFSWFPLHFILLGMMARAICCKKITLKLMNHDINPALFLRAKSIEKINWEKVKIDAINWEKLFDKSAEHR